MASDKKLKVTWEEARASQRAQCRDRPCVPAMRLSPKCVICVNEAEVVRVRKLGEDHLR